MIFNDLRPLFPFVVQQVGTMVQIKPFYSYHVWLDWFDLAPLDYSTAIVDLTAATEAAQSTADGAAASAAVAQSTADTALGVANDAAAQAIFATAVTDQLVIAVNAEKHGRATLWWDEATAVTGAKTVSRVAGMDYGVAYHAGGAINNEMKMSFVADLTNGGVLHLHCVTSNGAAIATITIDGVSVGTIDLYGAVQALNVDKTLAVAAGTWFSGRHHIHIKAASKNASSSAYFLVITKIWFTDNNDL